MGRNAEAFEAVMTKYSIFIPFKLRQLRHQRDVIKCTTSCDQDEANMHTDGGSTNSEH